LDSLRERSILIKKGKGWLSTGWLAHSEYIEGSGYVEVSFHAKLKPYLLGLKGYYTQYELEKIVNFKSIYAIRIFELLKKEQFKANDVGYFKRSFEYDELRVLLGIPKDEYTLFTNFKAKAIEIAVKDINANPDIKITQVDYPKTGRKVSHIVFHCEKAKQLQLDIDELPPKFEEVPPETKHPDYILELVAIGIDEQTAYKWKRKYTVARLREAIAYTKAMQQAGKIRDSLTGFLVRAVADNIGATWANEQKKREADKAKADSDAINKERADKERLGAEKIESAKIWKEFLQRTEEEQEAFIRDVLKDKPTVLHIYETKGKESAMIRASVIKAIKNS
jgi:hypothetical protein